MKTVTDWLGRVATYSSDDAGRLVSLVRFNGAVVNYGYDNADRLATMQDLTSHGVIASFVHTLDGNGNRTATERTVPRIMTMDPSLTAFTYNAKGTRLVSEGADTFGYDLEGQLHQGYATAYTFDYSHRPTGIGTDSQFFCDGSSNRLQAIRSGITTEYVYDAAGNLLAEADGNSNITKYYVYGNGLLEMVTPAGRSYCYHFDSTGHTIALTDENQTIVNTYAYDPYGNPAGQQETVAQPFKYAGQFGVMAEPNGFYYMRARYYDPKAHRFISEDPLGFDGGDTNLMTYVVGNPVMGVDPLGLWTFQIGFSLTGGLGAGGTYGKGLAISHDAALGWQAGTYTTSGGGGFGGAGGSLTLDVSVSANRSMNDLKGVAGTVGGSGSVPIMPWISANFGGEVTVSKGISPIYTGSAGIGSPGTFVETHGFVTSSSVTKIGK